MGAASLLHVNEFRPLPDPVCDEKVRKGRFRSQVTVGPDFADANNSQLPAEWRPARPEGTARIKVRKSVIGRDAP